MGVKELADEILVLVSDSYDRYAVQDEAVFDTATIGLTESAWFHLNRNGKIFTIYVGEGAM